MSGWPRRTRTLALGAEGVEAGLEKERVISNQSTAAIDELPQRAHEATFVNLSIIPTFNKYEVDKQIANLIEDFACYLSIVQHKKTRPEKPTQAWKRVYNRFIQSRKEKEKGS